MAKWLQMALGSFWIAGAVAVLALGGCACLNGDALWLSNGQKEVVISGGLSTLFDTEYSFKEDNLPFSFKVVHNQEFGHVGHSMGSPDFSKGGYIGSNSVLRFSLKKEGASDAAEFLVSNGVLKVVKPCKGFVKVERRTGPYSDDAAAMNVDELWSESVMGKLVRLNVGSWGFSLQLHKLGEYGVVYDYAFSPTEDGCAYLTVQEIRNLRWFHWASLQPCPISCVVKGESE